MTLQEFSYEFDILYNNIMSNGAPGISEYEKSVFLTKALELLIQGYFLGYNPSGISFEKTEECRRYLDKLVKTEILTEKVNKQGLSSNSVFYNLPENLWFITYEQVNLNDSNMPCGNTSNTALVIPITTDDYFKITLNPFRLANERRVLRLDIQDKTVELISKYNVDSYLVRFIEKPEPIILEDLGDLTIDGMSTPNECKLNSVLHRLIVDRAVAMAMLTTVPPTLSQQQSQ